MRMTITIPLDNNTKKLSMYLHVVIFMTQNFNKFLILIKQLDANDYQYLLDNNTKKLSMYTHVVVFMTLNFNNY